MTAHFINIGFETSSKMLSCTMFHIGQTDDHIVEAMKKDSKFRVVHDKIKSHCI
jgi:hypothetical protein